MKSTPLLMCGEMVRATIDGRKTQTRRLFATKGWGEDSFVGKNINGKRRIYRASFDHDRFDSLKECPNGKPGDQLWVRNSKIGRKTNP